MEVEVLDVDPGDYVDLNIWEKTKDITILAQFKYLGPNQIEVRFGFCENT